jgi:hypothetical protein
MIVRIVDDMLYEHVPDFDPEPDDLIVITAENCDLALAELSREDAEAASSARAPFTGVDVEPSEARAFQAYEIKAPENGMTDWTPAWRMQNIWNAEFGAFIAYNQFVTAVRIPSETIGFWVTWNLDHYAAHLSRMGEEEADRLVRGYIRQNADLLVYGPTYAKTANPDGERSASWWRVHDAILRGYLRFRIHIADAPDMPAAA